MPGIRPSRLFKQHEQEDAGDESLKALVSVADDLLPVAAGELVDHFGDLLRRVRLLHRKRNPHKQEKRDQARGDQQFQGERLIDLEGLCRGSSRIKTNRPKSIDLDTHQDVVQYANQCESFRHRDLDLSVSCPGRSKCADISL